MSGCSPTELETPLPQWQIEVIVNNAEVVKIYLIKIDNVMNIDAGIVHVLFGFEIKSFGGWRG